MNNIKNKIFMEVFNSPMSYCTIMHIPIPILLMIKVIEVKSRNKLIYIPDSLYLAENSTEEKFKNSFFCNDQVIKGFIKKKKAQSNLKEFIIEDIKYSSKLLVEDLILNNYLSKSKVNSSVINDFKCFNLNEEYYLRNDKISEIDFSIDTLRSIGNNTDINYDLRNTQKLIILFSNIIKLNLLIYLFISISYITSKSI